MNSKLISGRQMKYIIVMFLLGSSVVVGTSSKANQDSWICILLASMMIIPMVFIYCEILMKYPGENFFDIIIKVFGKIAGKIICFLYVWYALHLGSLVLRNFSEFIQAQSMPETPQIVILIFTILICIWSVTSGIENMGRISKFTFPILTCSVLLTTLFSFNHMNFSNINPILSTDITALLTDSYSIFSFPFAELVVILPLFSFVAPKDKPQKIFIKGIIIATILFLLTNLRNFFVLGVLNVKQFYFNSYQSVSIISIGEFFTRIEVLVGANFLLAIFIKVGVCLFASCMGLAKLCNVKQHKTMAAPCGLIMITLATLMYKTTEEMFKWLNIYTIYAVPFQVIIPIILFVTIEIKARKKKQPAPLEPKNIGSLD